MLEAPKNTPSLYLKINQPQSPHLIILCKFLLAYMVSNYNLIMFQMLKSLDLNQVGTGEKCLHLQMVQYLKALEYPN